MNRGRFTKQASNPHVFGRLWKRYVAARGSKEGGFTLVELLIAITVMPLVVGAISVGLVSVFSLHSSTNNRIIDSADAQLVSATFLKDVQSAQMVTTSPLSVPQCGTGHQLLGLQWDNGQTSVSYVVLSQTSGSSTTYALERYYCTLGDSATPAESSMLSQSIAGTQGPPTVTCSASVGGCSASTKWISATAVQAVSFTITEPKSNFSYTLTATPRVWDSSGGASLGGTPYAPFTLLDPSSCNVLSVGRGSLSISVGSGTGNGVLGIESTCPASVSVSNGGTLAASSVITGDRGLNSIVPNSKAIYPSTEYYDNQFSDPLASVSPPSNPVSSPNASCSSTQSTSASGEQNINYTCGSGIYVATPTFDQTKTSTVDFSGGGTYWFQQGLDIPNNVTVTFSPGTYIFDGSTALSVGNNVTINGSNVLFYVASGAVEIGENDNISLGASSGYDDVAFWDATNNGAVDVGENSVISFDGGVYMPQGSLVAGENVTFSSTFIVTDTAQFGNNIDLTIASP